MKNYNDWDTRSISINSDFGSYTYGGTLLWSAWPTTIPIEYEAPIILPKKEEGDPSSIHFAEEKVTKFEKLQTSRELRDEYWYEFKCQLKI